MQVKGRKRKERENVVLERERERERDAFKKLTICHSLTKCYITQDRLRELMFISNPVLQGTDH